MLITTIQRERWLLALFGALLVLIAAGVIWLLALGPRTRYLEPRLGRGPCFPAGVSVTIRPGGWTYCAADMDALDIAYDLAAAEAARGLETAHVIGKLSNGDIATFVANDEAGVALIRIRSVRAVGGADWLVGRQMLVPCKALVGLPP